MALEVALDDLVATDVLETDEEPEEVVVPTADRVKAGEPLTLEVPALDFVTDADAEAEFGSEGGADEDGEPVGDLLTIGESEVVLDGVEVRDAERLGASLYEALGDRVADGDRVAVGDGERALADALDVGAAL